MKGCCGNIHINPCLLDPGDAATLEVTVRLGEMGPISHLAIVETDRPGSERLEFWTTATAFPRVRVEPVTTSTISLFPNDEASVEFLATTYGTADDPPMSLDEPDIESTLPLSWVSPAVDRSVDGGLIERSRRFTLTLVADGRFGPRAEDVRLRDGDQVLLHYPVRWEVSPYITASPKMAVFQRGKRGRVVYLRSRDGTPFQITRIATDARIQGEAQESAPAIMHTVRIEIDEPTDLKELDRQMVMSVVTDHPGQAIVDIPLGRVDKIWSCCIK